MDSGLRRRDGGEGSLVKQTNTTIVIPDVFRKGTASLGKQSILGHQGWIL
jgi:hypothetical protein